MKLSLKMIAEKLESRIHIISFKDIYSTLRLGRPVFLTDESILLKDTLYITSSDRLPENLSFEEGCGLIIAGNTGVNVISIPAVILTDGTADIFTLYNCISEIFDFFNNWENSLEHILSNYAKLAALEKFLSASSGIFENTAIISDTSFNYISAADPVSRSFDTSRSFCSFDRLPDETVSMIRNNPSARLLDTEKDIFVLADSGLPSRVMVCNIFYQNKVIYHLTLSEDKRPFRETDYLFLEFLASYIDKALKKGSDIPASGADTLSDILRNALLSGSWQNSGLLNELNNIHWRADDSYVIFRLSFDQHSLLSDSASFYCTEISKNYPGIAAFEYHEYIVLLVNLNHFYPDSSIKTSDDIDLGELTGFLSENHLSAGISNIFENIHDIRKFYRQAKIAQQIGSINKPECTIHKFSDCILPYIFSISASEFDAEDLLSPVYKRLAEHDRANNTEYLKTLKEYLLQNMNAVQTASALFIHRATLIYRLKRICEIGQTELKEPGELLHLALSFGLSEYQDITQSHLT